MRRARQWRCSPIEMVWAPFSGHGLGWELMQLIIQYARSEDLRRIEGQVLRENTVMLQMCRELGFRIEADPEEPDVRMVKLPLD